MQKERTILAIEEPKNGKYGPTLRGCLLEYCDKYLDHVFFNIPQAT